MDDIEEDYLIEELNCNDLPEVELAQFEETQPLEVIDILPGISEYHNGSNKKMKFSHKSPNTNETEEILIQKFVCGESGLPDFYTKLEQDDDDDNDENKIIPVNDCSLVEKQKNEHKPNTEQFSGNSKFNVQSSSQLAQESELRKRTVLNPALQGLMGEANLCYARGQLEMAEKICLEIIRQNPLASEPFFTLAEIYETRDKAKYLNFLTIAAHLDPRERDQWLRIIDIHISEGNMQSAKVFYAKAIRVFPKDYDLRWRKGQLLEMMGEINNAMFTYLKMIQYVPFEQAELCLVTAKRVARHFHTHNKLSIALQAMKEAYDICGSIFSADDTNIYIELLILNKHYWQVVSCLRERTNLQIETRQENSHEIVSCIIPDDFLINFRSKLCVSLIHLQANHLLGYLIKNTHQHIPINENNLNFYIDIAEALMQEKKYAEAIELLKAIIENKRLECPAFIWLHQAECLRNLERYNEAIENYYRVIDLAPFCYEAKFTLSALLKQQGRTVDAVKVLEQDFEDNGQPLNARLQFERCLMLKQINEIDEYLEVGYRLLSRQSLKLQTREEMLALANGGSFYNAEGLKSILQMRNIKEQTEMVVQDFSKSQPDNSDLAIEDEYRLFIDLIETAFVRRKFGIIERLCFAMVATKRFINFHNELERIMILGCYFNDDCAIAFSYLRELISKNTNSIPLWNFLNLLIQKGQELRYYRYVRRLIARKPAARQMRLFLAHYHLYCSSYKYALNIYVPLFKENQDPLIALCIAVVFNQLSLQKKVLRKPAAVSQAIAFAQKYSDLRMSSSTEQEIYYNIGRIYHQAGLTHIALEYYERGLAVEDELIKKHEEILGLKQEIAYNIHLIYQASGNMKKARQYLYEYIVI